LTVINTNTAALLARAYGVKANQNMLKPMERLSSGLRINSASDDAAGLAVANKMTAKIRDYDLSIKNSVDMINLLSTAESALDQITNVQQKLANLAVQSASGTYVQQDRDSMELELYALVAEIDRIAVNTRYSDVSLLDGSFGVSASGGSSVLPVSIDTFNTSTVGRTWGEPELFDNGDFGTGTVTGSVGNVDTIDGWKIYKDQIMLGQGVTPGATVVNGHNAPIDPTPTPAVGNDSGPSGNSAGDDRAPADGTYNWKIEDGALRVYSGLGLGGVQISTDGTTDRRQITAVGGDVVHGPYLVSESSKTFSVGDKISFDWRAGGGEDYYSAFAYLLDESNGNTMVLLDETQSSGDRGDYTPFQTKVNTITTAGIYKFVFVAGALDDNSGTFAGGSLYVDNIAIDRARLLPAQQHLVSQISVLSVAEAENATDVLNYSMEQTSKKRAELGALINRYSSAIDGYSMMGLNMRQARSRIKDTEYTVETSKLAKQQILAQASMAMLAQANTSKNAVLELIN
jgi:flagellin-like hook-associated protein FlgL